MAKRELSSTLKNLKFMQRAAQREEKPRKEEEEVKPDGSFFSPSTVSRKCVVIMEGDPHPGAIKGRMSFQSFNPAIDKIIEEAENLHQTDATATSFNAQVASFRENGSSMGGADCSDIDKRTNNEADGDLKRKQSEVLGEAQYPNKSPRNGQSDQSSSPSNSRSSRKQSKRDKLDWSVLRPPKGQQNKG
ncbi:M-phase phosphoprotein 6 [Punica granatum]|uniref:M-phase phosphoprotein 6 n=1 Tax=Punica granatum TaxID=22663 RepID=A0A218W2B4_PUNGR|nr:M-phase phosphoprotein 6 [Punica granatum]OWM66776.1 hypothetical protein CDL15_Pgr010429 [Punica granatum]